MKEYIVGEKALYIPKYYFVYVGKIYERNSGNSKPVDKVKETKKENTNENH